MTPTQGLVDRHGAFGRDLSLVGRTVVDVLRGGLVVAVLLLLIVGFVAMSLGFGVESHGGVGPDRPAVPDPARVALGGSPVGVWLVVGR